MDRESAFDEASSIGAIDQLRSSFPYAAALLCYVVVERVLKSYVLKRRGDAKYADTKLPRKKMLDSHGGKTLREVSELTSEQFLDRILTRLTLGEVEQLLARPEGDKSAHGRNEAMHSNLYLTSEVRLSRDERSAKNEARYEPALNHLKRALDCYANWSLVERDGKLLVVKAPLDHSGDDAPVNTPK